MELVINGITKVFHIKEDATVRAGVYYDKNYGMQPVNIVRTYGEFWEMKLLRQCLNLILRILKKMML